MASTARVALTVAGSDSGGGAGIQADLKTFAAHGVFGTSALTAVTAQNTLGVVAVATLPPAIVAAQIEAVVSDLGVHAAKTGMLATAAIVETVAATLARLGVPRLVVDPVMVAKSGDRLLDEADREAILTRLLPLADVVTPNIPEAEALAGLSITTAADCHEAARRLLAHGARAVLVKGGHLPGEAIVDRLFDESGSYEFRTLRVPGVHTHGTGCTFAAALAAHLALGRTLRDAIPLAQQYVAGAIRHAPGLGRGHGPMQHEWQRARPGDGTP
jgi:hydroxymethylpyrimidine/phosphomethylpyrimidine kinase